MDVKEKIKSLVEKKTKGNTKKTIENLIVFLVLLIVTVISINLIWGEDEKDEKKEKDSYKVLAEEIETGNISETTSYNLEGKLESILSKISGVRKSTSFDYIFRNKPGSCNA